MYGIKTGLNEAFVIDTPTKELLCRDDPSSVKLLKPFLEGKDFKRWRPESRGLWIIYIPRNRIEIDSYPAIRDWLLPFKKQLEARATDQRWFELQQAQEAYSGPISRPKISYPHFNVTRLFSFEPSGAFSNDKSYFIPTGQLDLLALLNSRAMWFILSKLAPAVRGGFHELRVQYVETLPIPLATDAQKAELAALAEAAQNAAEARHKLQQDITRRIPDLSPPGKPPKLTDKLKAWWDLPDFAAFRAEVKKAFKADIPLGDRTPWEDLIAKTRPEIHALTAEIARIEREIDAKVYALFDLTPDEIALLESSI